MLKRYIILVLILLQCFVLESQNYTRITRDRLPHKVDKTVDKYFPNPENAYFYELQERRGISYKIKKDRDNMVLYHTSRPRYIKIHGGVPRELLPEKIVKSLIDNYGIYFRIKVFEEFIDQRGNLRYRVMLLGGGELIYNRRYRLIKETQW